nr:hypothetical protein GCM10020093_069930 [Planobispora longispora]
MRRVRGAAPGRRAALPAAPPSRRQRARRLPLPEEVDDNADLFGRPVPEALWDDPRLAAAAI